jgi:hypothetical protein
MRRIGGGQCFVLRISIEPRYDVVSWYYPHNRS